MSNYEATQFKLPATDLGFSSLENLFRTTIRPRQDVFYDIPVLSLEQTERIKSAYYQLLLNEQKGRITQYFSILKKVKETELERMRNFIYQKRRIYEYLEIYLDLKNKIQVCKQRIEQIQNIKGAPKESIISAKVFELKSLIKERKLKVFYTHYQTLFGTNAVLILQYEKYRSLIERDRDGVIKDSRRLSELANISFALLDLVDESYEAYINNSQSEFLA